MTYEQDVKREAGQLTAAEAAARLDGNEYRREGSKELWAEMKAAGLIAVFGASDDLCEFRGAESNEIGCYDGGEARFTHKGLLNNECPESDCPYHAREREAAARVKILWHDNGSPCWSYETEIPHVTFTIMEDGEPYCRGIVFALADVPALPSHAGGL